MHLCILFVGEKILNYKDTTTSKIDLQMSGNSNF